MKKGKILIVDDEPAIRESVQDTLTKVIAEIDQAEDGLKGLEKLSSQTYDAILSDIKMPNMNGIEFLREVRNKGIQTPFIVLTAHGDKNLALEALRLGAFEFIDKPFVGAELRNTMSRAVELGMELNFWSTSPEMLESLDSMSKENGEKSLAKLQRLMGMLSQENFALRQKLKKQDEEN